MTKNANNSDPEKPCYHCGTTCLNDRYLSDGHQFCCLGCKTVYELLHANGMEEFYRLESFPGAQPVTQSDDTFAVLDLPEVAEALLEFNDGAQGVVNLYIPSIHCTSCIWILEHLSQLNAAIYSGQVNFPKKTVRISFDISALSLKELVEFLDRLGYAPELTLEALDPKSKTKDRSLFYQLGVAGFAFGNVMFLSFPEYFESGEFWLERFKPTFHWIMLLFSIPVVFYAARNYFITAFKGMRHGVLTIDFPIALGIAVLFVRSIFDTMIQGGAGFYDSLTGLVFFLLLGKYFQSKTYDAMAFDRDYKSYFPIGVTRISKAGDTDQVSIHQIAVGDTIIIRHQELLPVDGVLMEGQALMDYSFVTGESDQKQVSPREKLFAGGKNFGGRIVVQVRKTLDQSYLTQLWSHSQLKTASVSKFNSLTDRISGYFTAVILSIAVLGFVFWAFKDVSLAFEVFTSVLIVACPCALALAAPFTLGHLLRYFGRAKFYLKDALVVEQMANIDVLVFDKTGTLSTALTDLIEFVGPPLGRRELELIAALTSHSNHPLSRALYKYISPKQSYDFQEVREELGKGIRGTVQGQSLYLGTAEFTQAPGDLEGVKGTQVHVKLANDYLGYFNFTNTLRTGIGPMLEHLMKKYPIQILSGDKIGSEKMLKGIIPSDIPILLNQSPEDKLQAITELQKTGKKVMMIGDGLNDSGALSKSDIGIAVSEGQNVFTPACDAIISSDQLTNLPKYISIAQKGLWIIKYSFILSFVYNSIGIGLALGGLLTPVAAAILMPLSSISVVLFTSLMTRWESRSILENLLD